MLNSIKDVIYVYVCEGDIFITIGLLVLVYKNY